MHMKTASVTIAGNINAMRYRTDVILLVLLLHICDNLRMLLAPCHAARSTLVMVVANNVQQTWPAQSLDLNPINHLLDL